MSVQNEKCVMILNEALPMGFAANTAAILGISIGKARGDVVGEDVMDQDGQTHKGIISIPVPILKGTAETIHEIRERLYDPSFAEVLCIDFSEQAQGINVYEEFIEVMKQVPSEDLRYYGIALCGPKKKVNQLCGSMPLLR